MKLIEKLRGYRTVIVAAVLSLAPLWDVAMQVISSLAVDPDLPKLIPEGYMPTYSLAVTVVMIWMRIITTTELGARR
jgi:hypothetical protein